MGARNLNMIRADTLALVVDFATKLLECSKCSSTLLQVLLSEPFRKVVLFVTVCSLN